MDMISRYTQLSLGQSLGPIAPELIAAGLFLVAVVVDLATRRKGAVAAVVIVGCAAAMIASFAGLGGGQRLIFSGMAAADSMAAIFKIVFFLATGLVALFSLGSPEIRNRGRGEYYSLLLVVALGACFMASAMNFVMVYLATELVTITSCILVAHIKEDRRASEAALKYILFGAAASGVMIYGISLLYGATGTLSLVEVSRALAGGQVSGLLAILGVVFVLAGIGYKIAAVPFHFWCPDVYEGAPTPITAFLSIAPEAAGFALLIRVYMLGFAEPVGHTWRVAANLDWPVLLAAISALTMTLGNLGALHQTNLKRMMAYSSIAHAGYILMGFVALSETGINAMIFYVVVYLFMNLGVFAVLIALSRWMPSDRMEAYRGLGARAKFPAFAMTVFLFSLTGIPPMAGFIGKFYLFAAVINAKIYWLAVAGVLNSVVSLYYYARVVKTMYFEASETPGAPITVSGLYTALLVFLLVPTLLLGIYWGPLAEAAGASLKFLF
jgi:NADH-quinone oxidoreductase subunit N